MIIKGTIKELVERLGGFVSLHYSTTAYIGDWGRERDESRRNSGVLGSSFDISSRLIMERLNQLISESAFWKYQCDGDLVDVIEEALANHASYGNDKDPSNPLFIKILECKDGYILRIRDSGNGFNPDEIVKARENGRLGKVHNLGEGFDIFMKTKYPILFTNNGTAFNLVLYK